METPNANLSRVMRHINGVYTQYYNRLKNTDGPLFRGRYKAILVDRDAYLLHLSRYIHRNPIDCKKPIVSALADYPWSSYPPYVGKTKASDWLTQDFCYDLLGRKNKQSGYASYVEKGTDEDIAQYYNKGNIATIIGDRNFKQWIYDDLLPELDSQRKGREVLREFSPIDIVDAVAALNGVNRKHLVTVVKGPSKGNVARKLAMYLCQELADAKLAEIAKLFNLKNGGSVSYIVHQVRFKRDQDKKFAKLIDEFALSFSRNKKPLACQF